MDANAVVQSREQFEDTACLKKEANVDDVPQGECGDSAVITDFSKLNVR